MAQDDPMDLLGGALFCLIFGLGMLLVKGLLQSLYQSIERNTQNRPIKWVFGYKGRTVVPGLRLAGVTFILIGVLLAVLALLKLRG